ncbi:unnamed protein product, partial [Nesidiocoris tenuis]
MSANLNSNGHFCSCSLEKTYGQAKKQAVRRTFKKRRYVFSLREAHQCGLTVDWSPSGVFAEFSAGQERRCIGRQVELQKEVTCELQTVTMIGAPRLEVQYNRGGRGLRSVRKGRAD